MVHSPSTKFGLCALHLSSLFLTFAPIRSVVSTHIELINKRIKSEDNTWEVTRAIYLIKQIH